MGARGGWGGGGGAGGRAGGGLPCATLFGNTSPGPAGASTPQSPHLPWIAHCLLLRGGQTLPASAGPRAAPSPATAPSSPGPPSNPAPSRGLPRGHLREQRGGLLSLRHRLHRLHGSRHLHRVLGVTGAGRRRVRQLLPGGPVRQQRHRRLQRVPDVLQRLRLAQPVHLVQERLCPLRWPVWCAPWASRGAQRGAPGRPGAARQRSTCLWAS
jgi:hypothetical protein